MHNGCFGNVEKIPPLSLNNCLGVTAEMKNPKRENVNVQLHFSKNTFFSNDQTNNEGLQGLKSMLDGVGDFLNYGGV